MTDKADNDALVREKRLWKVICSLEAMSRNYAGGHMWDHLDGEMVCEAAALLRDFAALRSTPQPKPLDPPAQDEVEVVAQFLHDEGGFDEAWSFSATWPEHPDDTGQREGGFVHIVPSDVQSKFRDVAHRFCARFPNAIAALDRHHAGDDALREENDRLRRLGGD